MANDVKLGYIRASKAGPSELEQRGTLLRAGVKETRIYVERRPKRVKAGEDRMPVRSELINRSARRGDEIVVSSSARFVLDLVDGLKALEAMGKRGVRLHVVSTGETHEWTERDAANLALVRSMVRENRQEITAKARAAAEARRITPKLEGERLAKAKKLWTDPRYTEDEVAGMVGVPGRTIRRHLGKRGTPMFGKVSNG